MAAVDSYSPCPCGSGQKFKWCCQKVESFADKAQRLADSGQVDAAINALDEGLRKDSGNPWLLTHKASLQIRLGQADAAKSSLRQVLVRSPRHFGALLLLTRCVLETEGPVNGAGMFQQMLGTVEPEQRARLGSLARVVAYFLSEMHHYPAAYKHLELARSLGDADGSAASAIRSLDANPAISPWLKDRLQLASTPPHWTGDGRERFEQALGYAGGGLWSAAAAGFDLISGGEPGGEADYNLGLCRLWLGDEAGALAPLRRCVGHFGVTTEAVDLEALCQLIAPIHPDDSVEQVQLSWPIRNRPALREALSTAPNIVFDGEIPDNPDDPSSAVVDQFVLLDRPEIEIEPGVPLTPQAIPRILGRVGLTDEAALLETYDDGRVDSLGDRFTVLAGSSVVAAHPRTKVIGTIARSSLALTWEWLYPAEVDPAAVEQLESDQRLQVLRDVWPVTPMPYLNFRTPERAARDGNAVIPLRAALCLLERDLEAVEAPGSLSLRDRLKIAPEPAIDPQTVDCNQLPFGRLGLIAADQLDDDQLITLYRRARRVMLPRTMEAAARALADRPGLFAAGKIDSVSVYTDLAGIAAGKRDGDGVKAWIAGGRAADSPATKARNAPIWDLVEVRLNARLVPPEVWVPELAVVLERYNHEPAANQVILMNLVEMGLIRMVPNPDKAGDYLLDSRPLQSVMAEYGPKVTTASGRLGVSATKPDLWTPGGAGRGGTGGGLWTPGSGSPASSGGGPAEKSKLILPGR